MVKAARRLNQQALFDEALKDNTLLPVRSLSGGFSEESDKANVSYAQSYSLVKFLIDKYGQDKMTALLRTLRDGSTVDQALQQVYGFDIEGFEDAWRADIGAQPRSGSDAKPTATPVPTIVPTFVPAFRHDHRADGRAHARAAYAHPDRDRAGRRPGHRRTR